MRCGRLLCITALMALCLSACTVPSSSSKLGVAPAQWASASRMAQLAWMNQYKVYQKNHPVLAGDKSIAKHIKLSIRGGTATFPPDFVPLAYHNIDVNLNSGACQRLYLRAKNSKLKTTLYACYDKDTVMFDPSHYDLATKNGSLIFTYQPLWQQGFTYSNLSSTGYVRLHDATIRVRQTDTM